MSEDYILNSFSSARHIMDYILNSAVITVPGSDAAAEKVLKKYYILNSAVITAEGAYVYRLITVDEARKWLQEHQWESTIAYPETAHALGQLTGFEIEIPVQRKLVTMEIGDQALVFRLTQRIQPKLKGELGLDWILAHCEIGILRRIRLMPKKR